MEDLFKNLSISKKNDDEELTKLFQNIKLNRRNIFKKPHKINRKDNGSKIQKKVKGTFRDKYTKNYRKKGPLKIQYIGNCIKCRGKIHKTVTNKFLNKKVYICNKCYNEEACINCLKKDMDCFCDNCLTTFL